jgi:tRNA pseudouridine synthase 10
MTNNLNDKAIVERAKKTLSTYKLCDHCLGRLFAKIGSGQTNQKRGETLRKQLKQKNKTEMHDCWLCDGLLEEIPHFAALLQNALKEYDFDTFLVGSKIDEDIQEREQELWRYIGSDYTEPIKIEINRETGKILEKNLGKEVDFEQPTIMAVVDTVFDVVHLQIQSLFIYGRYKKYTRDLPQTRWFCKICHGKGCRKCKYTGKMYEMSVEELVAQPFLKITNGDEEAFHGCGRADIDARMLGNGRPFVLEIKNPMIRNLNLSQLESTINTSNKGVIEVSNLRFSDRDEIARIKNAAFKKIYRIVIQSEKQINNKKLKKAAQTLRGITIGQFTPSRVAHRRANMVRERKIYDCNIESVDNTMAILTIEAESGTYIKELISGDDGRTTPNISKITGVPCKVTALDVIEIKGG